MRTTVYSLAVAGLALSIAGLAATDASAKPRRHPVDPQVSGDYVELPLTVNKRSFLDPGPVAPVGTGTNYVAANTIFNKTPDRTFEPSRFGGEALVGQPYVPGRTVPVVEFATGPNVGDVYAGPILGLQR